MCPRSTVGTESWGASPPRTATPTPAATAPPARPCAPPPDLAIGRLPAQTPEEAAVLVDKIARQRRVLASAAGRHLIAVDDSGPGDISFRAEGEALASRLPTPPLWADLALGIGPARDSLLSAWADGPQTTHYFGHGGHDRWADEALLTAAAAAALAERGR